jgi:hypothetical protein
MKELPMKMRQRMEEAGKDASWAEKVRNAATWDAYVELLAEKGIKAPADMKDAFVASRTIKTGELSDDDLEKAAGGLSDIDIWCPQRYEPILCTRRRCPYLERISNEPESGKVLMHCVRYNWAYLIPEEWDVF